MPNLADTDLHSHEIGTLKNCLIVGSEKFRENAKVLRACAAAGGNPMITVQGAEQMAKHFDQQAEDASALLAKIEEYTGVTLIIEE